MFLFNVPALCIFYLFHFCWECKMCMHVRLSREPGREPEHRAPAVPLSMPYLAVPLPLPFPPPYLASCCCRWWLLLLLGSCTISPRRANRAPGSSSRPRGPEKGKWERCSVSHGQLVKLETQGFLPPADLVPVRARLTSFIRGPGGEFPQPI